MEAFEVTKFELRPNSEYMYEFAKVERSAKRFVDDAVVAKVLVEVELVIVAFVAFKLVTLPVTIFAVLILLVVAFVVDAYSVVV